MKSILLPLNQRISTDYFCNLLQITHLYVCGVRGSHFKMTLVLNCCCCVLCALLKREHVIVLYSIEY